MCSRLLNFFYLVKAAIKQGCLHKQADVSCHFKQEQKGQSLLSNKEELAACCTTEILVESTSSYVYEFHLMYT